MIHDWLERGEPIRALIDGVDEATNLAFYGIVFYKDITIELYKHESIIVKLIGTDKKDFLDNPRQDNLSVCDEEDLVDLDYDDDKKTYTIFVDGALKIGELAKADARKLKKQEDKFEYIGVLDEIVLNESEKYEAKLRIFFKPR